MLVYFSVRLFVCFTPMLYKANTSNIEWIILEKANLLNIFWVLSSGEKYQLFLEIMSRQRPYI